MEEGRIDYDARARGTEEETDPEAATGRIRELISWFRSHEDSFESSTPLRVKVDCGLEAASAGDIESGELSSVGRELQFLVSHTVHHFAIIAIMCEAQGVRLDPDFGVAPSTLRYEASLAAVGGE